MITKFSPFCFEKNRTAKLSCNGNIEVIIKKLSDKCTPLCAAVKGLSAVTTPVHALADFLKQLSLNSGSAQSPAVCLKHTTATQESPQCANECGIVNWKVNLRRSQLSSGSDANDDRLPYSYVMSLSSDVFTWKNGYPVESGVCLAEG